MATIPICISSLSTVHYRTGKRGPVPKSCWACRSRKTVCKRPSGGVGEGAAACEGCQKRGLVCSMLPPDSGTMFALFQLAKVLTRPVAAIDARPPRRSNTAKTSYGSLPSSSTSSQAPAGQLALVPSGLETRLADNEMSETLGFELLSVYADAASSLRDPLYPPPILDYFGLQKQFEASGKRLSALSEEDQLTCRIMFASAARFRHSSTSSLITAELNQQLATSAQRRADAAGIWRRPSVLTGANLLMLHHLTGRGEIATEESRPYLVSLAAHVKALLKVNPAAIFGSGEGKPALGWALLLYDTCVTIERRESPLCTPADLERLLGNQPAFTTLSAVEYALDTYPWSATQHSLVPSVIFITYGRRLGYLLESCPYGIDSVEAGIEMNEIWAVFDRILRWAADSTRLQTANPFLLTIARLFTMFIAGPATFAQLAIIQYLEEFNTLSSFPHPPIALPNRLHLARNIEEDKTFISTFTGTAWSVSRLAAFVNLFGATSAWDESLHPAGPGDKLTSLRFLSKSAASVLRAYDSDALRTALLSLDAEQSALELLVAPAPHNPVAGPFFNELRVQTKGRRLGTRFNEVEPSTSGNSANGSSTISERTGPSYVQPSSSSVPLSTWGLPMFFTVESCVPQSTTPASLASGFSEHVTSPTVSSAQSDHNSPATPAAPSLASYSLAGNTASSLPISNTSSTLSLPVPPPLPSQSFASSAANAAALDAFLNHVYPDTTTPNLSSEIGPELGLYSFSGKEGNSERHSLSRHDGGFSSTGVQDGGARYLWK
ncbi:hypothetical protein JCM8547_008081 [Rhodosporidiobolus lusitaniae]